MGSLYQAPLLSTMTGVRKHSEGEEDSAKPRFDANAIEQIRFGPKDGEDEGTFLQRVVDQSGLSMEIVKALWFRILELQGLTPAKPMAEARGGRPTQPTKMAERWPQRF